MIFFDNINDFIKNISDFIGTETVWRGADGSYAVGETFPADAEEGETDYIEVGCVSDYAS